MTKKRKPKFQYIRDEQQNIRYYVFNSEKQVNVFCDMNNIENIVDCGGCLFVVRNKNKDFNNRVVVYYSSDETLVHELLHVLAYLNQRLWRMGLNLPSSEPLAYYIQWLYSEIKSGADHKGNKKATGWIPIPIEGIA